MTDHIGTPLAFTDEGETVTWRAEHEPYGRVWAMRTADSYQPLRLPGQDRQHRGDGAAEDPRGHGGKACSS